MGIKILTVDDSKTIRMIVARAFKSFDVEILEAANGVEGLAVASRERPDVIVLDITMPVMDGTEMLSRLKSNAELRTIPVIMLTAEASRDNVLRIAKQGVRDYLVKPFKEDQIVERIGRVVELKSLSGSAKSKKRFDDPLKLLLVDDKSAILELIRSGLSDTVWKLEGQSDPKAALEQITQSLPDVVIISTSLPEGSGFWLYQKLRAGIKSEKVPIFGLSVKTAAEEQARAQQLGFNGIITKPIDFNDMKSKVARTLNLDASYKYFDQRQGVLVLTFPATFNNNISNDISSHLAEKVTAAVDSGLDKLVIDLSQVKAVEITLIELCLSVMKAAQDLSLKTGVVTTETTSQACKNYEETKDWTFAGSFDEILAAMEAKAQETG